MATIHRVPPARRRPIPQTSKELRAAIDRHLEETVARHVLYLELRAEIEDGGPDDVKTNSLDVLDVLIADGHDDLRRKITLYRRFAGHPYAAMIPARTDERYRQLVAQASDLKAIWTAERFAAEVLGVDLERRGATLVGHCPFHQEKTPSFTVYPKADTFWCFGCFQPGDGVDIFAMLGRWQSLPGFRQQVEWLSSFTRALLGNTA